MTQTPTRPVEQTLPSAERARAVQQDIDRWILLGCVVTGTFILGIPGLAILGYALVKIRRAEKEGIALRPHAVTILGFCCLMDAGLNYIFWSLDLLPTHDSALMQTLANGVGRLFDGAYYLGYNKTAWGGTALASEKSWEICGTLVMYPMRIAAGWGFLKMKRWGYQFFLVSAWIYAFFWVGYAANMVNAFPYRFAYTQFGMTAWWIIDIIYATPFLMIPYLHTVNRELWSE